MDFNNLDAICKNCTHRAGRHAPHGQVCFSVPSSTPCGCSNYEPIDPTVQRLIQTAPSLPATYMVTFEYHDGEQEFGQFDNLPGAVGYIEELVERNANVSHTSIKVWKQVPTEVKLTVTVKIDA